ncbi:hypothetical protein IV203_022405 [Nitzschia inconspicua]|uniref:Uncharacterized protein n=1 Tax=Nitzschia inconspicua TaxID=303405 RepID=A0A9K3PEC2_9STRA|nr:hypothetical protein IV203_022405 [Nitzschia inconspicua]
MPRSVENPFKENRIHYVKYLAIFWACLLVAFLLFGIPFFFGTNPTASLTLRQKRKIRISVDHGHSEVPTQAPTVEIFPLIDQSAFPNWLARHYSKMRFPGGSEENEMIFHLDRDVLQESLLLGCNNIRVNQKPEGNFNYMYDFVTHTMDPDDNPVRQAGALWGLTLCLQNQPQQIEWQMAVEKGLDFFLQHSQEGPMPGSTMVVYPGFSRSDTGANALLGLSLVDYLRTIKDHNLTIDADKKRNYEAQLASTIQFLKFLQLPNQSFAQNYNTITQFKSTSGSPYFDGEAMLCLCKAARYIDGYTNLIPLIEQSAFVLAKRYTLDVWRYEHDSAKTKGFYQWSSMFLWEYWHAKWKDYEIAGDYVMVLGHWIIYAHEILERPKNTGYAFEGIVCAYDVASLRGHVSSFRDFERTIDEGLYKLGQWQVGGPLAHLNAFLKKHPTKDPLAIGGIMSSKNEAPLRIDTTQHQMHAVMLALEFVYTGEDDDDSIELEK